MQDLTEALLGSPDFAGFLFNNLSTAIFLVDRNFRVQKVNDAYLALFSREESESINQICGNAIGCSFSVESGLECGSTPACADCALRNSVLACAASSETETKTSYLSRTFYIAHNPVHKHLRIKTRQFYWNTEPLTIIAIDDVTELETQKERIQDLANRDPLTNLFNRRYFSR